MYVKMCIMGGTESDNKRAVPGDDLTYIFFMEKSRLVKFAEYSGDQRLNRIGRKFIYLRLY